MRWLLIIGGSLLAVVLLVVLIGALLPEGHTAAVSVQLAQPPESVFAAVTDVRAAPAWRRGLRRVEILSRAGEPLRWRETSASGNLTLEIEDWAPPRRLITRIDDAGQPFGGRWIYNIEPTAMGSTITITEHGRVYNPVFRFMSRFIFGHHQTLEDYVSDLGSRFGESVRIIRAQPDRAAR